MLSFAKPDCTYTKGSLSFSGTGLEFTATGSTVKAAVAALKAANTNTRVLLSVGGGGDGYQNWQAMNARCLKDLVDDFALDGERSPKMLLFQLCECSSVCKRSQCCKQQLQQRDECIHDLVRSVQQPIQPQAQSHYQERCVTACSLLCRG
jgi:hypothetical protein